MKRTSFAFTSWSLFALVLIGSLLASCKKPADVSDADQLENNVRTFFFLGDSAEVNVTVTDTIRVEELNEMIQTVSDNFNLIQQDIDTLKIMIDDWSYKGLDLEKENKMTESMQAKIKALEYKLKLAELEATKVDFFHTNRILNRLKRSIWANIAGFDATAEFTIDGQTQSHELLLDAHYNVVD